MPFVLIYGDLAKGIDGVVGLFATSTAAEDYGEEHNLGYVEKIVMELEVPKESK